MNEQMNTPMLPPSSGVAEWFSVWRDAVTKPNEQTFSRLAQSPNAKTSTALLWIFLGSLVYFFLSSLVPNQATRQLMENFGNGQIPQAGSGLVAAICGAPIAALISIAMFALGTGIIQVVAKAFGGRGTFEQLAYVLAAVLTPFYVITGVLTLLTAIPYVGLCFSIVSLGVSLYILVLEVMAIKGVNQFGWGQAIGSVLLPGLVFACCLAVGAFGLVQLLGPRITDVFNSIQQSLP